MGQTSQVLERIPRSYPGGLSYLGVPVKLLRYQSPTLNSKVMPSILSPCRQVVKQGTTREDRAKKRLLQQSQQRYAFTRVKGMLYGSAYKIWR